MKLYKQIPPTGSESASIFRSESARRLKGRRLLDKLATGTVGVGGFAIIASILTILVFILFEIAPLFRNASVTPVSTFDLKLTSPPVALSIEDNREMGSFVTSSGRFYYLDLKKHEITGYDTLRALAGDSITAVFQSTTGHVFVFGTRDGKVHMAELSYRAKFFEGKRTYDPVLSHKMSLQLSPAGSAIEEVACAMDDKQLGIAGITADGQIYVHSRKEEPLSGLAEVRAVPGLVKRNWSGNPLQLALDGQLKRLYMGSDDGKIYQWNLVPGQEPDFVASTRVSHVSENPITAFEFLLGGRTLVVGDSSGLITCWFQVRDDIAATGWRLTPIRSFVRHSNEVTMIVPSARGKGFLSSDVRGEIQLHYSTSGRTLAEVSTPVQLSLLRFAPKANGAFSLDHRGTFGLWNIHNPHPEAGVAAFFGKVWYEGYEKPEYVWQSTGGSDEYEPKLSLVPLIFGSLKGTLYALLFAIPLAIFGAIYTSQFMHPRYRSYIKPTVEIMAALPSVVLGFLAGLWLAPRIESILPGLLCTLVLLPLLIVSTGLIWSKLPDGFRGRFGSGSESLLLVPVFCFGIWISFQLSGVLERVLFAGDFRIWLHATLGLAYDQRNALIVGFAMGFAVIPIIYTISEDALSNVPKNLVSGSLALGANRWQTAIRVVLPTAAAGIFSAVMIGLGRAVGETMIVLMATGNTPTMDLNIFNGFRTLSANIAVEIPEAPLGGTLYRVLFLAAMLLFIMTFFVNTAAELIRQKLRERYAKL